MDYGYDWTPTESKSATTTGMRTVAAPAAPVTMGAVIEEFIEAADEGRALNRSGRPYRPSALRDVKGILRLHVAPALGERDLTEVRRGDIQALVDRLGADKLSESRIRSVISALRALYAYAIDQGQAEFNPADALTMPGGQEVGEEDGRGDEHGGGDEDGGDEHGGAPDERTDDDYEPIAVLPERIISLVLRAAIVVFVVIAIISLVQPA
jgi:Phage integrase, N-terminal SAM-like domain